MQCEMITTITLMNTCTASQGHHFVCVHVHVGTLAIYFLSEFRVDNTLSLSVVVTMPSRSPMWKRSHRNREQMVVSKDWGTGSGEMLVEGPKLLVT